MGHLPPTAATPDGPAEPQLIAAARQGEVEAFTGLVRLYQGLVRAYLGRQLHDRGLVEDVAQETFLGAFKALPSYDPDQPFARWLLGIARNQAGTCLRREQRRRRREADAFDAQVAQWAAEALDADAGDDTADRLLALQRCQESLPDHAAGLVKAVYFQSQDVAALAGRLGRSENALRLMFCRIRRDLRDCIERRLADGRGA